jgi:hypothetical protein
LTNTDSTVWEYNWHIHYSPILLRILAIILGLLSFFSFLGVISTMTGVANSSSVYFMAVHSGIPTFSGVLIFILITMGYAVYVTLWALFQMQFAGMMHLVPHRTSAVCLSFNARMCARLAAPMAFFYLGVSLIVLMLVILFIELSSYLSECSQLSETHVPPVCQALTCLIALSHVMCCAVLCCALPLLFVSVPPCPLPIRFCSSTPILLIFILILTLPFYLLLSYIYSSLFILCIRLVGREWNQDWRLAIST